MAKCMGLVLTFGKMVANMKAITNMIGSVEQGNIIGLMVKFLKEHGCREREKDKESLSSKRRSSMGSGKMIKEFDGFSQVRRSLQQWQKETEIENIRQ